MYAVMASPMFDEVSFLGLATDLTEIRNIVNAKFKSVVLDAGEGSTLIEVQTQDGYAFTALEKEDLEEGEEPEDFLMLLAVENFRVQAFLVPELGVMKEIRYEDFIDDYKFEELVKSSGRSEETTN
jgi:hypothetical protein